jgi:hypothetical protein
VALICHLFGIECHDGGTNFPCGGKNKRSVALKFATLAKGGTELSHGGRNKCRVASNATRGHANLKGGNYIDNTI